MTATLLNILFWIMQFKKIEPRKLIIPTGVFVLIIIIIYSTPIFDSLRQFNKAEFNEWKSGNCASSALSNFQFSNSPRYSIITDPTGKMA